MKIVQVSDSHLSPNAPYADANWDAVVAYVRRSDADLVVHVGDISLNGADKRSDLEHARRALDRLPLRWLAIPGNHDIGDAGDETQPVNQTRRDRYASVFGDASWSVTMEAWRIVGVDVQTLLGDIDGTGDLWDWLADALRTGGPTALFIHRPLRPWVADEVDRSSRYITEPARTRLSALVTAGSVRLVASGHVHQWRQVTAEGVTHVWGPSTWAVLPDRIQPTIGAKVTGIVEHELSGEGSVVSTFVRPDGLAQLISGDDFPSPY